nr:hypothetical protein [Tanacetum cinerariifolium]
MSLLILRLEEDDENEDVDIEEDDDAEIIFPYEVQGDQTPSPRDESSDSEFEFVGGLAPWALRRDLEALCRQERIWEAKSKTSRTKIALLGSKARIGKIEREILHHDLSGVEETLRNVVERLKALESEENATLKKKLAEKEVLTMPPKPMSKARMREIIRDQFTTSMNEFMVNMNSGAGGSGGASGSGGVGGSGGTDGNADGIGVRGAELTVPELT